MGRCKILGQFLYRGWCLFTSGGSGRADWYRWYVQTAWPFYHVFGAGRQHCHEAGRRKKCYADRLCTAGETDWWYFKKRWRQGWQPQTYLCQVPAEKDTGRNDCLSEKRIWNHRKRLWVWRKADSCMVWWRRYECWIRYISNGASDTYDGMERYWAEYPQAGREWHLYGCQWSIPCGWGRA